MSNLPRLKGESLKLIIIILLGWSCLSFADITTKYLSGTFTPNSLLTFSGVFGTILLSSWILYHKGWKGFLSPNWKWLIARGACIGVTATGIVNALALIPIADVYGITFMAPFLILILAVLILKEHVGWYRWGAVTVAFIGAIILATPQFNTVNIGIVYAMIATVSIGFGVIAIRKIGADEYLPLFILYPYLGILVANVPFAIGNFELPPFPALGGFIASSAFVLGGQLLCTYAISHAKETASLTPFVYVQIIWGVIFGYIIFGDIPTIATTIGLVLIISAGLYMIYRERRVSKQKK